MTPVRIVQRKVSLFEKTFDITKSPVEQTAGHYALAKPNMLTSYGDLIGFGEVIIDQSFSY